MAKVADFGDLVTQKRFNAREFLFFKYSFDPVTIWLINMEE
jgi:hypothetical protein